MWRRGNIVTVTRYKALRKGIRVETVKAFSTSQICPRCNARGEHVKAPDRLDEKSGRYGFFYCPDCGYTADRDYAAALNIGRRFLLDGNGRSSRLDDAEPAAYKAVGCSPADCSRRGALEKLVLHLSKVNMRLEKIAELGLKLRLVN